MQRRKYKLHPFFYFPFAGVYSAVNGDRINCVLLFQTQLFKHIRGASPKLVKFATEHVVIVVSDGGDRIWSVYDILGVPDDAPLLLWSGGGFKGEECVVIIYIFKCKIEFTR